MFSLMGKCFSCINKKRAERRPLTLAILGLDNAGKTTTTKSFSGEPLDPNVAPTVGYSYEKFAFDKYDITLYDLGGGKKIRDIWKNYLHEVYGLLYVVDSTAGSRLEEARGNLKDVLDNPHISGKPILLLANKQDQQEALDEVDICQELNIDDVVTANKCPCRIETCSALKGSGNKMDKSIRDGMKWMLGVIDKQYTDLKQRVDEAVTREEEKQKVEKAERKKRVEERRKARELKEEEERKRLGIEGKVSDDEPMINGDPFKKLNVNDLKKKEAKLKEEKRKKKELLQKFEEEEKEDENKTNNEKFETTTPRTNRSLPSLPSNHLPQTSSFSSPRSSANPLLPPLQKPLGTKFADEPVKEKRKKKKKSRASVAEADLEEANSESVGMKSIDSTSRIVVKEKLDSNRSQKSHDSKLSTSRLGELQDDEDSVVEEETPRRKPHKKKKKKRPTYVVSESDEDNTEKELDSVPRKAAPPPFIQVVPPSISQSFDDDLTTISTPPSSHRRKKKNRFLRKRADEDENGSHTVQSVREYLKYPVDNQAYDANDDDNNNTRIVQTGINSSSKIKSGISTDLPQVLEDTRRLKTVLDEDIL